MKLAEQNITTMLQGVTTTYVHTVDYNKLRSDCLSVKHIDAVAGAVTSRLEEIAANEIKDNINELTHSAHQLQKAQDASEENNDCGLKLEYKNKKKEHETAISGLGLTLLGVESLYLLHQLAHSGADRELKKAESRVRALQHEINTESQRNTPEASHAKLAGLRHQLATENALVSRLHANERHEWAVFYQHQSDRDEINTKIRNHESAIRTLSQQEIELAKRENMRNQRHIAEPLSRQALSMTNADLLDRNIARTRNGTNATCRGMQKTARNNCHETFLNQLHLELNTLPELTSNQKGALIRIIEKMQEHLRDLRLKQQQEDKLSQLESDLLLNRTDLANKLQGSAQLETRNMELVNENERLGATLGTLQSELKSLQEQRNFYAKASLGTAVTAGVGSVSAYFLIQAGIIALVPAVNIVVAVVVGVALLALMTTAIVAAVRTSYKQSEVAGCQQEIANNTAALDQNRQQLNKNQNTEIPQLRANITRIEHDISIQTPLTNAARSKAASSLEEAQKIQSTPDYAIGDSPHSLFSIPVAVAVVIEEPQPSAPPHNNDKKP